MNRRDLARRLNKKGYYMADSKLVVSDIFDALAEALSRREKIFIRGFGTFDVKFRPGRTFRNVVTGQMEQLKGSYIITFRPSQAIKDAVKTGEYVKDLSTSEDEDEK